MLSSDHVYCKPEKKVKTQDDVKRWERSKAYKDYLGFLQSISDKISNKKIRSAPEPSPPVSHILTLLSTLTKWVSECPPIDEEQQRFGNKAYRAWYEKLDAAAESMLKEGLLKDAAEGAAEELSVYVKDSFGNATRIDYGTGHEMAFLFFLCALFKMGVLKEDDSEAVGLTVFNEYMRLVRLLQRTYRMEPAGSQGVWALDDYQFVPFIWGAAQFLGNVRVKPKAISDYEMAEMLAPDYHLFACIKYISEVKTGPFAEHSNQLWNVSGVPRWEKVAGGLVKMYRAEVLSKFPVIQHVYFGSVFTLEESDDPVPEVPRGNVRGQEEGGMQGQVPMGARMPPPMGVAPHALLRNLDGVRPGGPPLPHPPPPGVADPSMGVRMPPKSDS